MQLRIANYSFDANSCDISARTRVVLSDFGRPVRYVSLVSVSGWLEGDTQSELSAAEAALRTALLTGSYSDLKFFTDAGATTAVSLINSASLSGVRLTDGPNFPGGDGGEYATLRRFDFTAEAEYLIGDARNAVMSWTETVSIQGTGGPMRRWRTPINYPPIRQQVSPNSVVRATQTGSAVGHLKYPTPPAPLWPTFEHYEQRAITPGHPKNIGRSYVDYPISWSYTFESNLPLVGVPALIPREVL